MELEIAMKTKNGKMQISLVALAVQSALLAMCSVSAHADDTVVAALKAPSNFVELGVVNNSSGSAKFGEYNGLNKSGAGLVGNFSVRGGDAYGEGTGKTRWAVTGVDLGSTSRSAGVSVSNQGQWSVGADYDELRHNLSDTYQTPYQGSMGGNTFGLPAGFGLISTTANGVNPTGTDNLNAAQKAALQLVDISSTRKSGAVNAGLRLNEQWDVKFDFKQTQQSGAKLMGFGSMAATAIQTGTTALSGEVVAVLPNPTNYKTNNINLALNWIGGKGHVTTSYYGSYFRDGYDRVNFDTFAGANKTQIMSTAPNNDFHQLNVSGGYTLAEKTKLTGGVSYARNTQNDAFVYDTYSMVATPAVASLNGLVKTTHADLKLVDQSIQLLTLSAGVKFDERKNSTTSNFYNLNALDGSANHAGIFPNTPYSNRKTQWELAGDYRITSDQHLRLAYNREDIKRWCDQYAASTGISAGASGYYPAGTNCVVATASKDDKLSAAYKLNASEVLNLSGGYSYSNRKTDSDPNAITARIGTNGNASLAAGNTLVWGVNAGDFRGFYPFFNASRKEQMLKAGMNWQAIEQLALGLNGRYTDDKYDSTYGVTKGNSWGINLDATYVYAESGSISTYLTQQHRQRDLTDLQKSPTTAATTGNGTTTGNNGASMTALGVPPGATWTDKLKDDDTTVGVGVKQREVLGTKLELVGDLTYSLGRTGYGTQLNYATTTAVNSGSLTCSSAKILSCGDLPVISNKLIQLKLIGNYQLDKSAKVTVGLVHQQLKSADYYYNGLQYGSTANTMMPTNQQAANYSINTVAASYNYLF
jgi:MtrB/PioB family decaheme-associated outer membrane protein